MGMVDLRAGANMRRTACALESMPTEMVFACFFGAEIRTSAAAVGVAHDRVSD